MAGLRRAWRWFRSRSTRFQAVSWILVALVVIVAAGAGGAETDSTTTTITATTATPTPSAPTQPPTTASPPTASPPTTPPPTTPPPTTTAPPPTTATAPAPKATAPTKPGSGRPTGTRATTPAPAAGTALAALARLAVKGRAPKTGYSRDQFGDGWETEMGCATRDRILQRDLTDKVYVSGSSCRLRSGILHDPYTGETIRYVRGAASTIDIDHVVALSDAWQKGAQQWSAAKRIAFANDPLNLLAVGAAVNRAKGDGDAATWLPPNKSFRCQFVARQIAVKYKYGLWVTRAEHDAMARVLATCPNQRLPAGAAAPLPTPPNKTTTPPPRTPAATTPTRTTSTPTRTATTPTRPSPKPPSPPRTPIVHPGSYCSTAGARGVTSKGTSMICRTSSTDSRLRWRRRP